MTNANLRPHIVLGVIILILVLALLALALFPRQPTLRFQGAPPTSQVAPQEPR